MEWQPEETVARVRELHPATALDIHALSLDMAPLPANEVQDGAPRTGSLELDAGPGLTLGVWEMTAGTACDIEVDECFLVLSGSATVTILGDDSSGADVVLELRQGSLGRLTAGMRTIWVVHEDLRKVYLIPGP